MALCQSWPCQQHATVPRATESQPQAQAHRLSQQQAVGLGCPHRAPQQDLRHSGFRWDLAHLIFESVNPCVVLLEQLLQLSMHQSKTKECLGRQSPRFALLMGRGGRIFSSPVKDISWSAPCFYQLTAVPCPHAVGSPRSAHGAPPVLAVSTPCPSN